MQRKDAFFRLACLYEERYARGRKMTAEAATHISDLQFTESYRVPFPYSRLVRKNLGTGAFMQSSSGVTVTDVDGNVRSEEHTSELQSQSNLVCRLLLEKKKIHTRDEQQHQHKKALRMKVYSMG